MLNACMLDKSTLGEDIDLSPLYEVCNLTTFENTTAEELKKRIETPEVIILNKIKLTAEILSKAKNLRLVCVTATGYDNIDIEYCRENNIAVCNVVDYSTHSVAQVTVSMVLTLVNKQKSFEKYVMNGSYSKSGKANCLSFIFNELYGKTWGIVGYGNIGKQVAKIAEAFGCKVIVCKRKPILNVECVDIETLCEKSDIITIHTPLNDSTRGIIGEKQIKKMKNKAIVVNTSRGAVIDEKAMVCAIKKGVISGFGTDVYETEPFSKEHPYNEILNFENVCFTPHMAWGAVEARNRCIKEISENIKSFANNAERNRVEKE